MRIGLAADRQTERIRLQLDPLAAMKASAAAAPPASRKLRREISHAISSSVDYVTVSVFRNAALFTVSSQDCSMK